MRTLLIVLSVALISACESGLALSVKVTVPAEVTARFSDTSRGVVVSDLSSGALPYLVLCGQSLKNPLVLSQDLGFGCLSARNGTEETIRVWVEPLPVGVDAGVSCSVQREFYNELSITSPDGGSVLASEPDAGWAQGSATGTWRRDLSPCGGVLNAELTLTP